MARGTNTVAWANTTADTYNLSVWYESTGTTQFALYYRTTNGSWFYWTSSPWFATASTWTQATFTTPAVPAGANGMSFGCGEGQAAHAVRDSRGDPWAERQVQHLTTGGRCAARDRKSVV